MKVRFDNPTAWTTADGRVIPVKDMETAHLLNTLRMFARKPHLVMSMIVADIDESAEQAHYDGPWVPIHGEARDTRRESMRAATSMSAEQLTQYAMESALGCAMRNELVARGVNVDNLWIMWKTEELADAD